ncbi:MAG: PIN domain-containing protein [Nocardioidaceae bacterium]
MLVDTNVFAYALDSSEQPKQALAQHLIDQRRDDIVVSTQALVELYAVCTRKLGMDRASARQAVEALTGFGVVDTDRALVLSALALSESAQLSIFDAAIVCAAQRAGCSALLTEDLNTGQRFGDVVVENPFER